MKQLLFIFRKYHVLLVGLLLSTTIHAQDVEVNGICYNVDLESMQATVVAGDYAFKDINIPEQFTYGGRVFTVTTIGEKAFYCDNPQTASNSPAFATSIIIPQHCTSEWWSNFILLTMNFDILSNRLVFVNTWNW